VRELFSLSPFAAPNMLDGVFVLHEFDVAGPSLSIGATMAGRKTRHIFIPMLKSPVVSV
jgi:hypothetical protein